jgi:hypothetical protein
VTCGHCTPVVEGFAVGRGCRARSIWCGSSAARLASFRQPRADSRIPRSTPIFSRFGIRSCESVAMRDRAILCGKQDFLCFADFDQVKCAANFVNRIRLRVLPTLPCSGRSVMAMIPRSRHVRRFGTLRAFVIRGYEQLRHERALAGDVAIERTYEHCGILRRFAAAAAACLCSFHLQCLHGLRDRWLRIRRHAAEAFRQCLGATHPRVGGVGRYAAISSDGERLAGHHRGVGRKRGRERKCDFRDGVRRGSVHGSGGDAQSGERNSYGEQPGESG